MEELVKRYDASTRFRGQILSVTEEGVKELSSFITKRITAKNADSIARMESTGKIESSNAEAVVLTGGKRLNMTQTNAYVTVWNRVVGHQRLGKEYELTQMDPHRSICNAVVWVPYCAHLGSFVPKNAPKCQQSGTNKTARVQGVGQIPIRHK